MITFTNLQNQEQTVTTEKAEQLLAYISKQIETCKQTIAACIALRDEKSRAQYSAQIDAMSKVASQITAAMGS